MEELAVWTTVAFCAGIVIGIVARWLIHDCPVREIEPEKVDEEPKLPKPGGRCRCGHAEFAHEVEWPRHCACAGNEKGYNCACQYYSEDPDDDNDDNDEESEPSPGGDMEVSELRKLAGLA